MNTTIMSSLLFRPAKESDRKTVYDLYMHTDANPYLAFDVMSEEEFAVIFSRLSAEGTMVMVESEGSIVGTYQLFNKEYRQSDTVFLATLIVDPLNKRKGFGTAILRHIIENARAQQKNRLELEVSVKNPGAIALYKKMGFEIEGTVRQSYRIGKVYYDDYRMSILLQ